MDTRWAKADVVNTAPIADTDVRSPAWRQPKYLNVPKRLCSGAIGVRSPLPAQTRYFWTIFFKTLEARRHPAPRSATPIVIRTNLTYSGIERECLIDPNNKKAGYPFRYPAFGSFFMVNERLIIAFQTPANPNSGNAPAYTGLRPSHRYNLPDLFPVRSV